MLSSRLRALAAEPARRADALWISGLGLLLRLLVVFWAAGLFPPTDDGRFYQVVAERIAAAYPPEPDGSTLFPFRRIFIVAARAAAG